MRAAINRGIQGGLRRLGYELHPYDPDPAPAQEDMLRARLLASERIDLLLDVGANEGQYALRMRRAGFQGRIVSFEPLSDAFAALERRAAGDPSWEARRLALSDADGSAAIHVAGQLDVELVARDGRAPSRERAGVRLRGQRRGAHCAARLALGRARRRARIPQARRPGLRDARAARRRAGAGDLRGVQAELALAHLYEGDSPWREVVDHLAARGFELAGVEPGFGDPDSGRMLQFDGVFLRS